MEKTILFGIHPYAFNLRVKFGTLEEMIQNAKSRGFGGEYKGWYDNYNVKLGGNFNKTIERQCGRRAAFIAIGVKLTLKDKTFSCYSSEMSHDYPTENDVIAATIVTISPWVGTRWESSLFKDELSQGLYPISADWDGVTLIERGDYNDNGNYVSKYVKTDTYRF